MVETDGNNVVKHDFSWTYDAKDNVTALTESIGGKSFSYTYAYDDDSRPTTFGYGDVTKQVTYDGHGRSSGTTVKNGSRTVLGTGYAYRDVDSTYTTTQVKSVTNSYGGKTANFNYTYDANGNILSVSGAQTVTYEYDDLGQLVWEKKATAGKAWNYTYDNGGNILSRTEYTCSSSGTVSGSGTTTSYTYGDTEWGDLLTAYDGEAISYDGIGNPLSYRGWTMSWQGGRQLSSMTKGSDTLSFAYNESGLRTSKTVNGITHSYIWQGSKLAADITDAYALYFHYDSSGEVIGFTRTANGADTEYFYVKNLQGDILKVITATGTEAAAYTYDAWGMLLTSTGDLAGMNPLRYRGYFYDTETGLYYLKSRYYDPEVCRFINPDGYNSTGQGILSANMFSYCLNNPTNYQDSSGAYVGAIIGIGLGVVALVSTIAAASATDTSGLGNLLSDIGYKIADNIRSNIELAKFIGTEIWEGIQKKNEKYPGEYTVYFLTDGENVRYVGRTKDLNRRMEEHGRPGSKTQGLKLYASVSGLNFSEARGLEQLGIAMYNTINAGKNTINGIFSGNPLLPGYIAVAWDFIYNEATNEFFSFVENHLHQ